MSKRLNPPIIEGIIPAQVIPPENGGQMTLLIPFQMNRAVSYSEVATMKASIKTVSTNSVIANLESNNNNIKQYDNQWIVTFSVDKKLFKVGQYYKIQLAYNENGFYSTTGTFKCTSRPDITINGLDENRINVSKYEYCGLYSNKDTSEKVYSYWFNIYDFNGEALLESSGELLHNSSLDTEVDTWTFTASKSDEYLIEYGVKTINGLEVNSPKYQVVGNQLIESNIFQDYSMTAEMVAADAYVELKVQPRRLNIDPASRTFVLLRASSEDGFTSWHQLTNFILADGNSFVYKDYYITQGFTYTYALQEINSNGIRSKRVKARPVIADFEDMYLSDGERQLRIRFNPKVSSFKKTILESKMDTIGGQYPFFFRNGNVGYKEFPISGLISLLADENGEFMRGLKRIDTRRRTYTQDFNDYKKGVLNREDMGSDYFGSFPIPSTSLETENFVNERRFKMEVLEWLTNGKPKVFRSPGEGNFIVRLMNTSLSPNDTLSRMLHTFSSTAYEIADYTLDNLRSFGMLPTDDSIIEMPSEKIPLIKKVTRENLTETGWIGRNINEVKTLSIDKIFALNIQKRPIVHVERVEDDKFYIGEKIITPDRMALVKCAEQYYDSQTHQPIKVDFTFSVSNNQDVVRYNETIGLNGYRAYDIMDIDDLCLGNGVYADIFYEKLTVEWEAPDL